MIGVSHHFLLCRRKSTSSRATPGWLSSPALEIVGCLLATCGHTSLDGQNCSKILLLLLGRTNRHPVGALAVRSAAASDRTRELHDEPDRGEDPEEDHAEQKVRHHPPDRIGGVHPTEVDRMDERRLVEPIAPDQQAEHGSGTGQSACSRSEVRRCERRPPEAPGTTSPANCRSSRRDGLSLILISAMKRAILLSVTRLGPTAAAGVGAPDHQEEASLAVAGDDLLRLDPEVIGPSAARSRREEVFASRFLASERHRGMPRTNSRPHWSNHPALRRSCASIRADGDTDR